MPHAATLHPSREPGLRGGLASLGGWMAAHRGVIQTIQWLVVGCYLVLVAVPAFLPLPGSAAHIWTNLTVAAQFAFWGIWWPFVLLSMVLIGRTWCGVFCPEGALTEAASRFSLNKAVPRWITWRGWPFTAFVCTTVYGQMVSVYQYPAPVLLVLGGSTLAAISVGLVYGRNKRVWCRYLCPVTGVFALLAKLAPVHFRVDTAAWQASQSRTERPDAVICAPLVPLRTMRGASACHMCGRCSGFRDAIELSPRSAAHEVVEIAGGQVNGWETALIVFGLLGIAVGAFHWSASPWFGSAQRSAADWLVGANITWPIEHTAPWWILTNYPAQNDVLTLLDGALLLAYITATALVLSASFCALLAGGVRVDGPWVASRFHHLAQSLIPIAGVGVFLGLSANTVTLLHGDGVTVPMLQDIRAALLAVGSMWSIWLAWRIGGRWTAGLGRVGPALAVALCSTLASACWILLFWVW